MSSTTFVSMPRTIALGVAVVRRLPRGRYRVMNWLSRNSWPAFTTTMRDDLGGYIFRCDLRDSIAREVCFTGQYEPQETALVRALLGPGMTFVDVGANWGYFTLLGAHLVGSTGCVIAVEADPRIFAQLDENLKANAIGHATPIYAAAADKAGTMRLEGYDATGDNWGLSKITYDMHGPNRYDVQAESLDTIIETSEVGEVDLLKMDIEGAEGFALNGLRQTLADKRVRNVILELHPSLLGAHGFSVDGIFEQLSCAGYTPWHIDHSPEAVRRAAYAESLDIRAFLHRERPAVAHDWWPHVLWTVSKDDPLG